MNNPSSRVCFMEGLLLSGGVVSSFIGCSIGAVLGSFANVCIYRVPRGRSVVLPRSRCPRCHGAILWFQNIPILSYFMLGRRCVHCRCPIPVRYAMVELLMGVLMGIDFIRGGQGAELFLGILLTFLLVVVAVIDLEWRIIPDVFSLGLLGSALVVSPLNDLLGFRGVERAMSSGMGSVAGYVSAWLMAAVGRRVFRREALGGGDVKLLAGLGAYLGWRGVFTTWLLSSVLGTILFVSLKARRKMNWGAYLPFGPFLAAGAWAYWMWPDFFSRWWGF